MIVLLNVNQHTKHTKIVSKSTLKSSHQGNCGQIKFSVALTDTSTPPYSAIYSQQRGNFSQKDTRYMANSLNEPHEVHNNNFNFQD